jgi:hypothetical protein
VTVDNLNTAELELAPDSHDFAVRVPLTAGEHHLVLDNMGDDWLELEYLEVGHLRAPARVLTLRDSTAGIALAWIQHRDFTWESVAAGSERSLIVLQYRLDQMPPGRYNVEIWDPLSGAVLGEEVVRVGEDRVLLIQLLPMGSELSLRAFLQPDLPTFPATTASPEAVTVTATPTPGVTDTPTSGTSSEQTIVRIDTPTHALTVTRTPLPTLPADAQMLQSAFTNTPRPRGGDTPVP